jgi:threonine/homoserine/homoserine lactone efflux protein
MTAATIAKGYSDKNAGALIAVGHAVIEIPLIAAIYFGFGHLFNHPRVIDIVYIVGGLALLYLGFRMFRSSNNALGQIGGLPTSSIVTGTVVTGTNPAFYIWWVTVGIALIVSAAEFGLVGLILFTLVHWLCDLGWSEFLSIGIFRSRRWWTQKVQKIVFTTCALVLIGFGVWFCLSAFL